MSKTRSPQPSLLLVNGSPRREGNTEILLERVARGFVDAGGRFQTIRLQDSGIQYCTGCFRCLRGLKKPCRLNDPMQQVYDYLLRADCIVLGSPVYFWAVSAQMKTFLDRLFPFGDYQRTQWCRAFRAVPFAVVLVYAEEDPLAAGVELAYRQTKVVVESIGGTVCRVVHGSANDPGQVRKNRKLLAAAMETGILLYEKCRRGRNRQKREG